MGGKLYLILFLYFLCSVLNFADSSNNLIYNIPQEGYSTGGANTAKSGLGNVYKNPAAITGLTGFKAHTSYSSFFENTYSGQEIGFGGPVFDSLFAAISIPIQTVNSIEKTTIHGQSDGTYNDIAIMPHLTLAQYISETVSIGSSLSFFHQNIDSQKSQRLSLDFGIQMDHDLIKVGAAVKNLVLHDSEKSNTDKQTLHLGAQWQIPNLALTIYLDSYISVLESIYNMGATYLVNQYLSFNAGLNQFSTNPNIRLGVGLSLKGVEAQFSFSNNDLLGITQKFSLSIPVK